jgi:hypothetical protein
MNSHTVTPGFRRPWQSAALVTIVVLCIRLGLIVVAPMPSRQNDIAIYMEAGRLHNLGINPYNLAENKSARERYRTDQWAYREYLARSQARWDYYVSGNLPLSTLVWAWIDRISPTGERAFQIWFAMFDALSTGLSTYWIVRFWPIANIRIALLATALTIALNPVFYIWGTLIPEDKGLTIGMIVTALLLSKREDGLSRCAGAAVFGCSIAYKLLGIFFALGAFFQNIRPSAAKRWKQFAFLLAITGIFTGIWFVPFGWHAILAAVNRAALTEGLAIPGHSSPWVFIAGIAPQYWHQIRNVICVGAVCGATIAGFKGLVSWELTWAYNACIYVALWLISGSPDRFNVVAVPTLLVLALRVGCAYWSAGVVAALILGARALLPPDYFMQMDSCGGYAIAIYMVCLTIEILRIASLMKKPKER